jgi:hypothetical protein
MEAVLDFGRGRQKWLKSCMGSAWVGGGDRKQTQAGSPYRILMGGGGSGRGLATVCPPHVQSSFSFLFLPSSFCCRGLFQYKKACGKPYTIEHVRFASISKKNPLSKLSFAFLSISLPLLKPLLIQGGGASLGQPARRQPWRPPRKQRAAEGRPARPLGTLVSCDGTGKLSLNR